MIKVLLGLICNNEERVYLEEMSHLENWCEENSLCEDWEEAEEELPKKELQIIVCFTMGLP